MRIRPTKENVRISGRCTSLDEVLYLGFSGSFIEFEVNADEICVDFVTDDPVMREDPGSEWYRPEVSYCDETYFGQVVVIVDGKKAGRLSLDEPAMCWKILLDQAGCERINGECPGNGEAKPGRVHVVRLVKLNEAAFGLVGIRCIHVPENADIKLCPTTPLGRRIEFIGDSITCGYGNEGKNGVDIYTTAQQNAMDAYAIRTASKLSAEYQLVSWSGIGIITNYVGPEVNEPDRTILMPWLYPYTDKRLYEKKKLEPELWDFSRYIPDVVVLYLGTNDASYTRGIQEREEFFAGEYAKFLEMVHEKNPGSAILCTLGTMETSLCAKEDGCVKAFQKAHPEVNIDFLPLPLQSEEDGIGTDGHPSKITHEKVAQMVSEKLRGMLGW